MAIEHRAVGRYSHVVRRTVYGQPLLGTTLIGAYLHAQLRIENLSSATRYCLHAGIHQATQTLDNRDTLAAYHVEYLNRRICLHRHVGECSLHAAYHRAVGIQVVLRMHTSDDMHLRDVASAQLAGARLNLVERHIPRIGIPLPATERAELAVEEADVRGFEVHVAIIEHLLATRRTLTLGSQLTEQPQRRIAPQHKGIFRIYTFATTHTRGNIGNISHRYFGALIYTNMAIMVNIMLGSHTHIHGSIEPLTAICSKTRPNII